ncbi:histidine kinase [Halobiforma lacisalsi AJ5]|uniref:Histidine kinase n=1 Tax=Natronobacterium lacisalsi AJ5 TaxID=358396 RepID=M0LR49_NATLA|nr:histidine kinase [Halobiforma lacisalsi AJ5]EMA36057.1 integral membrane sensor signal transduction histidine kinase [Halobiforma lacisalsi AJ5]
MVVAIGAWYLLLAVATAVVPTSHDASLVAVLVVFAFIGGSGAVIFVGGYRLPRTDIDPLFYPVISTWCLVGIGVMVAILALYHAQPDTGLSEPARSLPILTGFSAVAGFGVGLYAARAKTHARRLERQNELLERTRAQLEEAKSG